MWKFVRSQLAWQLPRAPGQASLAVCVCIKPMSLNSSSRISNSVQLDYFLQSGHPWCIAWHSQALTFQNESKTEHTPHLQHDFMAYTTTETTKAFLVLCVSETVLVTSSSSLQSWPACTERKPCGLFMYSLLLEQEKLPVWWTHRAWWIFSHKLHLFSTYFCSV